MKFSTILGNDAIKKQLKHSVDKGTLFHAYMFEGQDGVGKKLTANTFAQALLCSAPIAGEPCQSCSSCRKVENGNHSDYHYLTSDGKSVKDAQIEEMQNQVRRKPFESERSVFIINQAATITLRAQNRLLKTLEEPSGQSVIILLVENIDAMAATVLSRCSLLRFSPVDRALIQKYLLEHYEVTEEAAAIAASFAYGSVGRGQQLLVDEEFQQRRQKSIRCAEFLVAGEAFAYFSMEIKDGVNSKEEALELLEMMEYWYRDALLLSRGVTAADLMNCDCIERLQETLRRNTSGEKHLCRIIEIIEQTKKDVQMNVRTSYALKNMFLELSR